MAFKFLSKLFIFSVICVCFILSQADDTNAIYISPDDEDNSSESTYRSAILKEFLEQLELRSGLAKKNYTLSQKISGCGQGEVVDKECVVNYQGDLIWEARFQIYNNSLMQSLPSTSTKAEKTLTLDGCLNFTTTVAQYQDCMEKVRTKMLTSLQDSFDQYIQEEIQKNCSLYELNCFIST